MAWLCALLAAPLLSGEAHAQAGGGQVQVATVVINGCQFIAINAVDFGDIASVPLSAPDLATGTISMFCRATTQVTLSLSPGQNHDGTSRRMSRTVGASSYFLEYELYRDATLTTVFQTSRRAVPWNPGRTWTVYGRIPAGAGALASSGLHSDTVVVTATF